MALETWITFVAASAVLLAIPGPTVLLCVAYSLGHGRRAAIPTAIGVTLGDFVAMTVSMAGLGALLIASSDLYMIIRWIGAAYLVYLGINLWLAPVGDLDAVAAGDLEARNMMRNAFFVTVLNPKALVFFVAFVPQFIDPTRPFLTQATIMIATFTMLAGINALAYALAAARARRTIQRPPVQRFINRLGGGLLVGAGIATAATGKAHA